MRSGAFRFVVCLAVLPVYLVMVSCSRTDHHPVRKIITLSESIWTEANSDTKDYMILTAGGLLKVQKGSSPVWAQTASGSFSIFFTASVTSSSVS